MENLEKSWNFKIVISRPGKVMEKTSNHKSFGKVMEKTSNHKSFGKVMEICFNHVFVYAEFEIINIFFKERRSKCKPAYAFNTQNVVNCSCLVMEICFKVLEKSWKSIGQNV